jgi:hypothetical protein
MFMFLLSVFLLSSIANGAIISIFLGGLTPEYWYGLTGLALLTGAGSTLAVYLVFWLEDIINGVRRYGMGYFVERKN